MTDYYDDQFNYRYGTTRRVKGGIRARTTRGAFGNNWWATRWIAVLESFHIGGRLARGRSYARQGQVLSLEISEGLVQASVQGSQRRPYSVEVQVKTIPAQKWIELSKTSLRQIVIASKLLAGQMPENIEQLISQAGASLFPGRADDLKTQCSCPDDSNPCKHIAAVYYLIGEEFDRDPFLLFQLRGMTKEKLLDLILVDKKPAASESPANEPGADESEANESEANESAPSSQAKAKKAVKKPTKKTAGAEIVRAGTTKESGTGDGGDAKGGADGRGGAASTASEQKPADGEAEHLPSDAQQFWKVETFKDDFVGSVSVPAHPATLLKRLGPLPFWRSEENLFATLAPIYSRASERALQILGKDLSEESKS